MKAMSVRAPWAYLFFPEYFNCVPDAKRFLPPSDTEQNQIQVPFPKNCENRRTVRGTRPPIVGQLQGHFGPLMIHVSQTMEMVEKQWAYHFGLEPGRVAEMSFPRGCLLGIVDVVETRFLGAIRNSTASPWHERMSHGIYVARPRLLPEAIPFKGQLGIFDVPYSEGDQA